ncbi:MAG: ATPase [Candidatus Aenigmatarchaeota archaeon]|nr:MAG: ATPase [Candidatus Aenigmarchaeota archaeon]
MEKEKIIEILSEWNFWGDGIETGIERDVLSHSFGIVNSRVNKILAITGVRRCGKSFLSKQIAKRYIDLSGEKNTLIVNFEEVSFDEELSGKFLLDIFEAYNEIVGPTKKPLIILDEVQRVMGWERFVRSLHEKNKARIIVTGSSSKLMSEELATLLTGRTVDVKLLPLSFREFLRFRGFEPKKKLDILTKKEKIRRMMREYLEFGGFPEVTLEDNKKMRKEILRKIYEDVILKDVVLRLRIKNFMKLEVLANFYTTNFSSPITFNSISRFLNLPVKTVEIYSKGLEISNLFFFLRRFSFSIKEQEKSPRKVYLVDNGLFTSTGFRTSDNFGKLMENLVFLELKRRASADTGIFYWRDPYQREVDFVVKDGRRVRELIQVCYDISDPNTKRREEKSLIRGGKELGCRNLSIITWDYEGEERIGGKRIGYIPLWKWIFR